MPAPEPADSLIMNREVLGAVALVMLAPLAAKPSKMLPGVDPAVVLVIVPVSPTALTAATAAPAPVSDIEPPASEVGVPPVAVTTTLLAPVAGLARTKTSIYPAVLLSVTVLSTDVIATPP